MPPSQLRRLKSSLREHGVTGQQKSKKQKKQANKSGSFKDTQIQRNAALDGIREQFNPFELRAPPRARKHDLVTGKSTNINGAKGSIARPGVTKGFGEENRRHTLLKEIQRRKKVGGILDRRFGENDPKMTPEEKALERFVKEKQRGSKKNTLFDLEEGDEDEELTHFGQSLSFDKPSNVDDFQEDLSSEERSDHSDSSERPAKRRRLSADEDSNEKAMLDGNDEQPAKPKPKKEVMSELIAKSKMHKYERQQAKEDDDDLRAELDRGLPDLLAFMRGAPRQTEPKQAELSLPNGKMNPDRAAILDGKDRAQAEREYDERLRQMTFDKRSKPTEPTLTEEEKLAIEAQRLQDLEQQRLFRMKGEQLSDDEEQDQDRAPQDTGVDHIQEEQDTFGLGLGLAGLTNKRQLEVEDEDDFVIEDDLVALDAESTSSEDSSHDDQEDQISGEEDAEFVRGLLNGHNVGMEGINDKEKRVLDAPPGVKTNGLAYTYNCPQSHEELLQITLGVPPVDLPTIVQRIRALYHPKLQDGNKAKLAVFSTVLVDHVSYLANRMDSTPFAIIEAIIRHVHSLAKMFPEEVARAFRAHLKSLIEDRPLQPTSGDLIMFTAIGTTFPTSDHFHQVVTPAMLYIGFYLGQRVPQSLSEVAKGVYLGTLCLQYQKLSRRYVPELLNYILNAIHALVPTRTGSIMEFFPLHSFPGSLRLEKSSDGNLRKLTISDIVHTEKMPEVSRQALKLALLDTLVSLCGVMAETWTGASAFTEIFEPVIAVLKHLGSKTCALKLGKPLGAKVNDTSNQVQDLLQQARVARRPLHLHNHRPLPIKTSVPKFEESFNPDKHYDPDRDRAEMNKLKAEHKKERKGALRELRKDANFIARESLREKKEKDAQYEKKFKRLVAEIQGEEGHESKIYEREKKMRKGKR
ncbi:MAG: hypothetical protein LQ337_006074 [Flavoplaca oasis]|nr:MAG: hypothetical protein LQ337_006074 [Flavoplaca oasis]